MQKENPYGSKGSNRVIFIEYAAFYTYARKEKCSLYGKNMILFNCRKFQNPGFEGLPQFVLG